ncbi:unnamed protein product [Brassica oleracea var. botrytis]
MYEWTNKLTSPGGLDLVLTPINLSSKCRNVCFIYFRLLIKLFNKSPTSVSEGKIREIVIYI